MQLSKKLNTHQKQISGYERGIYAPSIDLLIKMADLFTGFINGLKKKCT
ncbi:MAG: helix-turn-helix transcriptional regulator [Pseudomonadota bacterium]